MILLAQAADVAAATLSPGQLALYPLAIIALGALVKWWMSGTERAIQAVAIEVKLVVATQGEQGKELARMDERLKALRSDHERLHNWKNEFVESIGSERK